MKRLLLALASAAMISGSAGAMYIVGSPAGYWDPKNGIELTEVDGSWQWTGTVGLNEYFAFATEIGDFDWDTFNSQYRIGPTIYDALARPGEMKLYQGMQYSLRGNGVECLYTLTEIKDSETPYYQLTIDPIGEKPVLPDYNDKWEIVGEFSNWNDGVEMFQIADCIWIVTMTDFSGPFKFRANGSWELNYGAVNGGNIIASDNTYAIEENGENFEISYTETVDFRLDLINKTLTASGLMPNELALRGTMNDWEWSRDYLLWENPDDGTYGILINYLEAGSEFKIANPYWNVQYSTENLNMVPGETYPVINDVSAGNMGVNESYTDVLMVLDINKNTFSFLGTAGIDDIEADESEAVYYNLHGVKVEKPSNGLYIRVANGKASKVIVQ